MNRVILHFISNHKDHASEGTNQMVSAYGLLLSMYVIDDLPSISEGWVLNLSRKQGIGTIVCLSFPEQM